MRHYHTPRGTFRAYYLAIVVCWAAFMQGYDSGVAGGVLTMVPFQRDFSYSDDDRARVNSLTVGLQQLGSLIGTVITFYLTSRLGRRTGIALSAIAFVLGVVIETVNSNSLLAWYTGRVIAGLGQGGVSVCVPMYSAEMAPKEIRGRISSMYQWMYTLGIFTSYWTDYGVVRGIPDEDSKQWQIPVAMQLIGSGLLLLGIVTLKDSVRWLAKVGRMDEAWESLVWVRGDDSEATVAEFAEIRSGIKEEYRVTQGRTVQETLTRTNVKKFGIAALIFMFQQGTGATALAYFGPQFFKFLVGPGDKDLLLTGLFGAIKVAATSIFIICLADRFARRTVLMSGGVFMSVCMLGIALLYKLSPPEGGVTSAGVTTVILLFLNIIAYNWSWGSIVWAYIPEMFPTRIRELGVASAMVSHWLFSFIFTVVTPYMIRDLQWGTFVFYAVFDAVLSAFTFYYVEETRGKSLEETGDHTDCGGARIAEDRDSEGRPLLGRTAQEHG